MFRFSLLRKQNYSFTAKSILVEHSQKRFLQNSLLVGRDLSLIVIELVLQKLGLFKNPGMSGDRQNALDRLQSGLIKKIVVSGSCKQSQHVNSVAVYHCKPQCFSIYFYPIRDQHTSMISTLSKRAV